MNRVYIGFGALAIIFLIGFFWLTRKGAREKRVETMKAIVWFCLCNGCGWVWCSYLLAYLGRTEIAESLSKMFAKPEKPQLPEADSGKEE